MRRVAIRAYRRIQIAPRNRVSVHALLVVGIDLRVATPAGLGDIRLVRGAFRILVAQDVVRAAFFFGRAVATGPISTRFRPDSFA